MSTQRVREQLLREWSIAIICLVVLFVFLARWVVTPLASIRHQMRSFSVGEFSRLEVRGGAHEIVDAVDVFNTLHTEWITLR